MRDLNLVRHHFFCKNGHRLAIILFGNDKVALFHFILPIYLNTADFKFASRLSNTHLFLETSRILLFERNEKLIELFERKLVEADRTLRTERKVTQWKEDLLLNL